MHGRALDVRELRHVAAHVLALAGRTAAPGGSGSARGSGACRCRCRRPIASCRRCSRSRRRRAGPRSARRRRASRCRGPWSGTSAVTSRARLCIQPSRRSCRMPASTIGYPVRPCFHASSASSSERQRRPRVAVVARAACRGSRRSPAGGSRASTAAARTARRRRGRARARAPRAATRTRSAGRAEARGARRPRGRHGARRSARGPRGSSRESRAARLLSAPGQRRATSARCVRSRSVGRRPSIVRGGRVSLRGAPCTARSGCSRQRRQNGVKTLK